MSNSVRLDPNRTGEGDVLRGHDGSRLSRTFLRGEWSSGLYSCWENGSNGKDKQICRRCGGGDGKLGFVGFTRRRMRFLVVGNKETMRPRATEGNNQKRELHLTRTACSVKINCTIAYNLHSACHALYMRGCLRCVVVINNHRSPTGEIWGDEARCFPVPRDNCEKLAFRNWTMSGPRRVFTTTHSHIGTWSIRADNAFRGDLLRAQGYF